MKKNYKKLAVLVAIMIVTLSIASTGFAANTMKNLQAYYRDIKIFKNGAQVQFTNEPFIVDGTTYVPLRDMSEVLGKDVTWNGPIYRIDINDRPGTDVTALTSQIYSQQMTISQLEAKIKTLEAQVSNKVGSLDDLEDLLNDDYSKYKDIKFEIEVSGTKTKIKVEVYVDLSKYDDEWYDLTEKQITSYIQDIVDDVEDEFSDATISGFIEDSSKGGKELVSFSVSSKGKLTVNLDGGSSSSGDLDDLEDDLNYDYADSNGIEDIILNESGKSIKVTIYVYEKDWDKVSYSKQDGILEDIYDDIVDYDSYYTNIYGEIRDGSKLYDFTFSSSGKVTIK